jgi:hypothetical protein
LKQAKDALCSMNGEVYKIWVMMWRSHTSEHDLTLYCVFRDDTPLFCDYTPFFSPGGLLLGLHSAFRQLLSSHKVLIFFQDASFPTSFTSPSSPNLLPLTHALDDFLERSSLHSITGFWASRSWTWKGKHTWWEHLIEEEFHATLDLGLITPPSRMQMFLEWATDWVPLGWEDY